MSPYERYCAAWSVYLARINSLGQNAFRDHMHEKMATDRRKLVARHGGFAVWSTVWPDVSTYYDSREAFTSAVESFESTPKKE